MPFSRCARTTPSASDRCCHGLEALEGGAEAGPAGAIGRLLFPDALAVVRNLRMQLEIRQARQAFVATMRRPSHEG